MEDVEYMKIALEEARNAYDDEGKVGAVIVDGGKIISRAGSDSRTGLHAEHNALLKTDWLDDVRARPDSIAFLTYSPCMKRIKGKGISCCDLIIRSGAKKVVYGAVDPNFGKEETEKYLRQFDVEINQIEDEQIVAECNKIFEHSNQL